MTRYTEVGRSGDGARIVLLCETEAALRERNHDQEKSGGLSETMNGAQRLHFCDPQRNYIGSIDLHSLKKPT